MFQDITLEYNLISRLKVMRGRSPLFLRDLHLLVPSVLDELLVVAEPVDAVWVVAPGCPSKEAFC